MAQYARVFSLTSLSSLTPAYWAHSWVRKEMHWHHDNPHNDTQRDNNKAILIMTALVSVRRSVSNKPIYADCRYAECLYGECCYCGAGWKRFLGPRNHFFALKKVIANYFVKHWVSKVYYFLSAAGTFLQWRHLTLSLDIRNVLPHCFNQGSTWKVI